MGGRTREYVHRLSFLLIRRGSYRKGQNDSRTPEEFLNFSSAVLPEMLKDHEFAKAQRAMEAMLRMKKIDIRELGC
jgi:hypothetical protein